MNKQKFYNEELNRTDEYLEVWKYEIIKVKDISDLLVYNHYWQDAEGELWLDFNDPNENFRRAFDTYRKRKGYLSPQKIKLLRHNLQLSQRAFSERLGISYAKLSQIENNKRIQTLPQEIAFRKAQQDYLRQGYLTAYPSNQNDGGKLTELLAGTEYADFSGRLYSIDSDLSDQQFKVSDYTGGAA